MFPVFAGALLAPRLKVQVAFLLAVFGLVIRQGMVLVVIGVLLGIGGALAATRLLTAQLFAVTPTDPGVFIGVAIALTVAGLVACVLPARRATRADPIAVLRLE